MNFFIKKLIYSDVRQSKTKAILATTFTIAFSILIAIVIACLTCDAWKNFGKIFSSIFSSSFDNLFKIDQMLSSIAIFIVAGLSFIFAYKAGLFNIGISGQMMMAGTIGTILCHMAQIPPGYNQLIVLICCIISGAIIGGLIGALKTFLNVNEVVSSIMLNWIIYYLSILLLSSINIPRTSSGDYTNAPHDNLLLKMSINNTFCSFLPLLIIAIILVFVVAIIIYYTVMGKKQKITGLSKTFAFSSGYNIKANLIIAMAFSGGIAGILGAMVYCGYNPSMPVTSIAKAIPQEGFNGISVGLISMSNPFATIPISFIFAFLQSSSSSLQTLGIDNHIVDVVFGIIIYGAAIISLFLNIKPYWWTLKIFKGKQYSKIKHEQNLANLELINLVNEYKSQFKKCYFYNRKVANATTSLKIDFFVKIKIFFANIRYIFSKFWMKLTKKQLTHEKMNHLDYLQNLRNSLIYRRFITEQNKNDKLYLDQIIQWADQLNLPIVENKNQYKIIKKYVINVWVKTCNEINNFYKNCFYQIKKPNKKTIINFDYKYDPQKINQQFLNFLHKEISRKE